MDQVVDLRRRLNEYLATRVAEGHGRHHGGERRVGRHPRADPQRPVPDLADRAAGVFLILLLALRDPWACLNLVATMILTYAFALGITHRSSSTPGRRGARLEGARTSCSCCWWPSGSITTSS